MCLVKAKLELMIILPAWNWLFFHQFLKIKFCLVAKRKSALSKNRVDFYYKGTNPFSPTKTQGNLFWRVKVDRPLLAGQLLKSHPPLSFKTSTVTPIFYCIFVFLICYSAPLRLIRSLVFYWQCILILGQLLFKYHKMYTWCCLTFKKTISWIS